MEIKKTLKEDKAAIILCGGKGSRLGVLGKRLPKSLVQVQKKEILWYIINILSKNKFSHLILPTGYKGNVIKNFVKKKKFNLKIDCVETGKNSNIGFRIAKVIKRIKTKNVLLLNGDAIFDLNIKSIYNNHTKKNFELTFLSSEITYQYGTIGTELGKIKDFRRNLVYDSLSIRGSKKYKAYNYCGMSIIKTNILKKFARVYKNNENFEQTFFPLMIKKYFCNLEKITGFWHSIDNIKDLDMVNKKSVNKNKFLLTQKLQKKLKRIK